MLGFGFVLPDTLFMITLAICDDHEMIRAGILSVLPKDIKCVLNARSLEVFLAGYAQASPDISVVDLALDSAPGAAVITTIRAKFPDARIIIYSMRDSLGAIVTCYKMDVGAFVSKNDDTSHLIEAIRRVHAGNKYFPPGMAERIALHELCNKEDNPRDVLTDGEMTLFLKVATGALHKDIAAELALSRKTVSNKIFLIRDKLGVDTNGWLAIALRYGLVSDIG